ncbi:c-type cytochrome [Haliea sp.]
MNTTVLLLALSCLYPGVGQAETGVSSVNVPQLAQMVEYIAVDYVEAVKDGQVVNKGEYQEMLEFSRLILENVILIQEGSTNTEALVEQARTLQLAIESKRDTAAVRQTSASLRTALLARMSSSPLPDHLLPTATTASLFESQCASCHGPSGRGDGVLAAQLEPAPTNFSDRERASNRSLLGLYAAISDGIDETAMPGFDHLSEQQRWSLAFHVGGIAFQSSASGMSSASSVTLQQLVTYSPAQLTAKLPMTTLQEIESLRADPLSLFAAADNPLKITRDYLLLAQAAYERGDYPAAQALAVSAYLDGFEPIENSLNARDTPLRQEIEAGMMEMRDC